MKVATRASSLLYRGFEYLTRAFEIVTLEFELVTCLFKLVTCVLLFYDSQELESLKAVLTCSKFTQLNTINSHQQACKYKHLLIPMGLEPIY